MAVTAPFRASEIVRIRGDRWRVSRCTPFEDAALLEVEGDCPANQGTRTCFVWPCETVDKLAASQVPRVVRPARWWHAVRRTLAEAAAGWTSLRAPVRASLELIPFQLEPALAMVQGDACRFLIADAVGLGKTIQAGLMIAETIARSPSSRVLIVAPASLRHQWHEELSSRFGLHAEVLDSAAVGRLSAQLPATLNPWLTCGVAITSIDFVKRPEVMRGLEALIWDVVVFDEAHGLAGRSDRAAAAAALAGRARTLVMLTATPHPGEDEAFARLCALGAVHRDDRLLVFQRTRADAGIAGRRRTVFLRVQPTPTERAMHEALFAYARRVWSASAGPGGDGARLAMAVLGRRACSSASSLVRSVERRIALLTPRAPGHAQLTLPLAAAGEQDDEPAAVLATPGLRDARDEQAHLHWILLLAREAARTESKLEALKRLLRRTAEPAIVFTEYRDTLEHMSNVLHGISSVQLHGGLTERERRAALRAFSEGPARLLLATDAAGEGLNLHQRSRLVINLELPWTPRRLEQRAGRVDRIGQRARPHAVSLVAAGTSEETVIASLARRQFRIKTAMKDLRPPAHERDIAASVFGGTSVVDDDASRGALPEGLTWVDRRRQALDETSRLVSVRRFAEGGHRTRAETRPVLTRHRRRSGLPTGSCVWAFRLIICDRDGRVVLETVVGGSATGRVPSGDRGPATTRAVLAVPRALESLVIDAAHGLQHSLEEVLKAPLDCLARREIAVVEGIRRRQARLAASLLQRGLFDRRSDLRSSQQQSLLEDALSRSAQRLDGLAASRDVHIASRELTCGLFLE